MPHRDAKLLDVRTTPIAERIAAIDDFVAAGYEVLWRPELRETKVSQTSGVNVRYRHGAKGGYVRELIAERLPSCRVRYAF